MFEPLEAGLDRARRCSGARRPAAALRRSIGRANLVASTISCAPSGQGAAEIFLRGAALAIGVRGVEERDAEIERLVHDRARRRHVDAAAEIVAAEPDRRDDQAGAAEIALFQRASP